MIDNKELLKTCMSSGPGPSIRARLIYDYVIDPYKVWCEFHVPIDEKDQKDIYLDYLMDLGKEHEKNTIEKIYPFATKLSFATNEEGFDLVITSMSEGVNAIGHAPLFFLPEGLIGIADLLEKNSDAPSLFGDFHYTINEIKLAKNIKEHHVMQGAFYNYVIGKIQEYTPPIFYTTNRDGEKTGHAYNEDEIIGMLKDIREIYAGKKISPTYGACDWPWTTYANQHAIDLKDLSLIGGIGKKTKIKLNDANYFSLKDVSNSSSSNLMKIKGIGKKTAPLFITRAKAILQNTSLKLEDVVFNEVATEIFLDLEGTGEQQSENELIAMDYLIGVTIRTKDQTEYIPFLAKDLQSEKTMFVKFIEWLKSQTDYIIYHWHHYEKTHLKKMSEKYKLDEDLDELLFSKLVDLHKIAKDCIAFPTYSIGLKEIAKYVGFNWRDADISAMASAVMYIQYAQTGIDKELGRIIDYNEDDCNATLKIKDWIVKNI